MAHDAAVAVINAVASASAAVAKGNDVAVVNVATVAVINLVVFCNDTTVVIVNDAAVAVISYAPVLFNVPSVACILSTCMLL